MQPEDIDKLIKLDYTSQVAFAYLTCERLYPNYVYYSERYNFGEPEALRNAIDFIYSNIFRQDFDLLRINSLVAELDKNTPEDGGTALADAASTACGVICNSFSFFFNQDTERLEDIAGMATEFLHHYIQEIENLDDLDADFENNINQHPHMQREEAIQTGILRFLMNTKKLNYEDISILVDLQESEKRGSLGL
jgi:uncharacterized protein YjaG (DUF416 family)